MTDTPETVTLRLLEFIAAVQRKAGGIGTQTLVGQPPAAAKTPLLTTYHECLRQLSPNERTELDRIIQKMSRPLAPYGNPDGATTPHLP